MGSSLYVYGIIAAGSPELRRDGVCGEPVRVVEEERLAAVVGDLPDAELRVRRRDLQAHLDVITDAFRRTPVVPCRFGTIFPSEQSVRDDLLSARSAQLEELLEQLGGKAQFTLTARYDEDLVLREVVASEPEIRRLRAETMGNDPSTHFARVRLGELVAGALDARREHDAAALLDALTPHVEAVALDEPGRERVLRASLLVPEARRAAFERAVEDLAAGSGGRILFELVGPLPPTAFVELAETEVGAWA